MIIKRNMVGNKLLSVYDMFHFQKVDKKNELFKM